MEPRKGRIEKHKTTEDKEPSQSNFHQGHASAPKRLAQSHSDQTILEDQEPEEAKTEDLETHEEGDKLSNDLVNKNVPQRRIDVSTADDMEMRAIADEGEDKNDRQGKTPRSELRNDRSSPFFT